MALADRNLGHMAGGFVLMGTWAVFANRAHPWPAPLFAGLVQGTLTALITLGLKRLVEALAVRLRGLPGYLLPPLSAAVVSVGLLFGLHTAAGTPEVWATLAVPSTVATLYAALYTVRLRTRT